jgi:hypothetical protein
VARTRARGWDALAVEALGDLGQRAAVAMLAEDPPDDLGLAIVDRDRLPTDRPC